MTQSSLNLPWFSLIQINPPTDKNRYVIPNTKHISIYPESKPSPVAFLKTTTKDEFESTSGPKTWSAIKPAKRNGIIEVKPEIAEMVEFTLPMNRDSTLFCIHVSPTTHIADPTLAQTKAAIHHKVVLLDMEKIKMGTERRIAKKYSFCLICLLGFTHNNSNPLMIAPIENAISKALIT